MLSHNGTYEDIKVQIIGHCDPNDQGARKDFWIFFQDDLHPKRFKLETHIKILNKSIQYFNEHFWFNSSWSHIQKDSCLNYYEHFYLK